jgi:hypothetical protein
MKKTGQRDLRMKLDIFISVSRKIKTASKLYGISKYIQG